MSEQDNVIDFPASKRFLIKGRIGIGGMGEVFLAYDNERRSEVALKVLRTSDPTALYMFKREFRSLADVNHENLVQFHELVSAEDTWFLTMEFVDGRSLTRSHLALHHRLCAFEVVNEAPRFLVAQHDSHPLAFGREREICKHVVSFVVAI